MRNICVEKWRNIDWSCGEGGSQTWFMKSKCKICHISFLSLARSFSATVAVSSEEFQFPSKDGCN